ncbi:MAG: sigma-54 dependent transcriptional regulator [Acidobacteriia bacterium]|nr:sigma-54 dependent transcriptional regulator [Terriglobia bacterium]
MQLTRSQYANSTRDAANWRSQGQALPPEEVIFGSTPAMALVRENIRKLAATAIPVLITGESGTGKELIAQLLHRHSPEATKAFIQINCAAIPATLIESELFGYEKGSFTGAVGTKPGRVEMANSGTLFLDEIGELDLAVQAKLLQLLQDGQFSRLGGQEDKKVNVRFIFATNRDLEEEILAGNFREDLYYRVNVVNLRLPALRERLEDIPVLAQHFIDKHNEKYNCRAAPLSESTIARLQEYHWPGNIRQMENLMKRYVVLGSEEAILSEVSDRAPDMFKFTIPPSGEISLKTITRQAVRQVERQVILKVVEANHWNRKQAAKRLHISYRALLYKLKEVGVPSERRRAAAARKLLKQQNAAEASEKVSAVCDEQARR